jgi:hypothetical protein
VVAATHVDRFQDQKGRGELNHAARIARSPIDVTIHSVQRIPGIDLEVRGAIETLVCADGPEWPALGNWTTLFDDESGDASFGWWDRSGKSNQRDRQAN